MIPPSLPHPPFPGPPPGPQVPQQQQWGPLPGRQIGMPVGSIIAFPGEVLGSSDSSDDYPKHTTYLQHYDWRVCDGSEMMISEYPELYAVIGTLYTSSSDTDTFKLPDFRGQFLRAVDPTGDVDKDRKKRTAPAGEQDGYYGVGSTQDFALQQHKHTLTQTELTVLNGDNATYELWEASGDDDTGDVDTQNDTSVKVSDNETRPTNISVYWLIKCKPDVIS